jgi:hypothetical protein
VATPTAEGYQREDGVVLVEIRLTSLRQLFNSLDPAPFHEQDLDKDAEAYIVDSVSEFALAVPMRLVLHLPRAEAAESARLEAAIHNYFAYRQCVVARELKAKLGEGRNTLAIALVFLALCLLARETALSLAPGAVRHILAEGLLIVGWVAMWRPIQILLYDWWPIRRRVRRLEKLSRLPVEVRSGT